MTTVLVLLAMLSALAPVTAQVADDQAESMLRDIEARIGGFEVLELPAGPGEVRPEPDQALTVEDLAGVALDDDPPVLGEPVGSRPNEHTDGFAPGEAPYTAQGIQPFRLREFTAEFNYGGWHNFNMMEYAATHGFSVIFPYVMEDTSHFPAGTQWLRWGTFVDWHRFFADHDIPWGRFDLLADLDVATELLASGAVWEPSDDWISMVDLEHGGVLSPDQLRTQEWYPKDGSDDEKGQFEARYYEGYTLTYTAPIEALHKKGWTSAGVYPQPYGSGWFALLGLADKGQSGLPDPASHWPWLRYGQAMFTPQDVLYPDIYVYYWSPQNVAYIAARIDFDRALLKAAPAQKPYRPYLWPLLHGGDAEPHWWAQQPLPNEDMQAMYVFAFFSGCDGVVLWNWSDVGNHHVAPPLWLKGQTTAVGEKEVEGGIGADVMVGDSFELTPDEVGPETPPTPIKRYDVLAVTRVDEEAGTVSFQHIDTSQVADGPRLAPERPVYTMPRDELIRHLRPSSEAVAGAVEGLALVKALEPFLRRGEVKVDIPALDQFAKTLPVVRRVKLGNYHLVATYDPLCIRGKSPREITLTDFDGRKGLTVVLPADEQTRVFILREP